MSLDSVKTSQIWPYDRRRPQGRDCTFEDFRRIRWPNLRCPQGLASFPELRRYKFLKVGETSCEFTSRNRKNWSNLNAVQIHPRPLNK